MNSYYAIGDIQSTVETGRLILSYIDDEIKASDNGSTYLSEIKKSAQQVLYFGKSREPVRNTKTFGRNERVKVKYAKTGEIVIKKYKHVEEDLRRGNCVMID